MNHGSVLLLKPTCFEIFPSVVGEGIEVGKVGTSLQKSWTRMTLLSNVKIARCFPQEETWTLVMLDRWYPKECLRTSMKVFIHICQGRIRGSKTQFTVVETPFRADQLVFRTRIKVKGLPPSRDGQQK